MFVESIANAGMPDSFVIVQLSGKLGENQKRCEASVKELEARRWESDCFPYCWPRSAHNGKGDSHRAARSHMGG